MYSYKKEVQLGNERISRLVSWSKGIPQGPAQLDIELHKRCNLNCLPCSRYGHSESINYESKRHEMPIATWISIIKQANKLGALIFNIEGACEPFAYASLLMKVMKNVKRYKMYGIVTTNGTLLTDRIVKKIVEIGWDRIHFSLDGHINELNDFIRGKGSFKKTTQAIRSLNKWKKYYHIENPMLNINTVISNKNYSYLCELVELANSLNADYIFLEPIISYHKACENLRLTSLQVKELDELMKDAKVLADKYNIDNNFSTKDKNLNKELINKTGNMETVLIGDSKLFSHPFLGSPCFKPWDTLAIKYNGIAGHCGLIEKGDSVKHKTLHDIWYGTYLANIRLDMTKKKTATTLP